MWCSVRCVWVCECVGGNMRSSRATMTLLRFSNGNAPSLRLALFIRAAGTCDARSASKTGRVRQTTRTKRATRQPLLHLPRRLLCPKDK